MDQLDSEDGDTLLVCSDWLLSQRLQLAGRHAVYFETGLLNWTPPDNLDWDLFIRAEDWIYDGNRDLTQFRGVSLGKVFSGEISMCLMNFHRLDRALRALIERFRPKEIVLFDYINDISVLERPARKQIVEAACRDLGVHFEDRGNDSIGDAHIADRIYTGLKESLFKRILLGIYTRVLESASNLRCLFNDRDARVFVMVNSNMLEPLAEAFRGGALTPMFLGRTLPKKPKLLWRCLRYGVLLVTPREPQLSAEDYQRLEEIRADVTAMFRSSRDDVPDAVASHVLTEVLGTDRLADAARKVRMAERFFERYKPRRLIVDGVRNALPHVYIEVGHAQGAAIDYIWHSPLTPDNKRLTALGGDPRTSPRVTRCLSWGPVMDAWLDDIGAKQPRVRTGCPLSGHYKAQTSKQPNSGHPPGPGSSVLVLQYTPTVLDLRGLNANTFVNFVTVVRKLREMGFEDVVMKLHPGPGRWKKSYFEDIAEFFDLRCPVFKKRPYYQFLERADVVVGPVTSGAMFETLAAGKPYHTFLMEPHGLNPAYYGEIPLLSTADHLPEAFRNYQSSSARELLDAVYGLDEIPHSAERFWEILQKDVA